MELSSTIAQPLTSTATSLKPELDDKSFDLGDDTGLDVQAALGPFYKPSHSLPAEPVASTSQVTLDDVQSDDDGEAEEDAAMEARIAELEADAFSDDIAEDMIADLKEIGMFKFIQKYVILQGVPLPKLLLVFGIVAPRPTTEQEHLHLLRALKITLSRALRNREPLEQYTTADDAARLLHKSRNIIVLTGAGVSTNCGIPDFRSSSGIYARLQASGQYPELTDPQEMFDIEVFRDNPEIFYSFAHELYPSDNVDRCSATHRWIRSLELDGKLLRNYTQNIDTLEQTAGIQRVLAAHGSFATASCIVCKTQYPGETIKDALFAQTVPMCSECTASQAQDSNGNGRPSNKRKIGAAGHAADDSDGEDWVNPWHGKPIVKPDITFFGQALDDAFDRCLLEDREVVDLLVVMGTSLQVAPVSELLSHIPHRVPQILINRDPVPHVMDKVDIALLGDCDEVVTWLKKRVHQLSEEEATVVPLTKTVDGPDTKPELAIDGLDNVWFFSGANKEHRWINAVRQAIANGDAGSSSDAESDDHSDGDEEHRKGPANGAVVKDGSPSAE